MTRIEALIELRDKVKAGDYAGFRRANRAAFSTPCQDMDLQLREEHCLHAYKGSLDAAKALHEAVLPGWGWQVFALTDCDYVAVLDGPEFSTPEIEAPYTPARAWLLAILEALIAQEQSK